MPNPSITLPKIPDAVSRRMAEIGPRWGENVSGHVRETIEMYSAVLAQAPRDGIAITRDIAYGPHARQVLDVHAPDGARNAAVLVFAHGGAFIEGDKERTPEIYANVLRCFARHGVVGVNMEYRLAPEAMYPAASEDVAGALAWTRANIARFGGNPANIFLMGHSAGAAHTGSYAYDARLHGPEGPRISGHIVVSGRVRAEMRPDNPNAKKVAAYYGTDVGVLNGLVRFAKHERERKIGLALQHFFWTDIAANWLPAAQRLCGAQSRTYDYLHE